MSVNSSDLESLAVSMHGSASNEAEYRNAAGRYYYSAWHYAQEWCDEEGEEHLRDGSGGMHASFFNNMLSSHGNIRRAGYLMQSMHNIRIMADYHLDVDFDSGRVEEIKNSISDLKKLI